MQRLTNLITNTMDDMFLLQLIKNGDKQAFVSHFEEVAAYFGDYAQQFLKESKQLLAQASDRRHHE